jgi:tetratricopeptide (TPR) repeat protein
MDLEVRASAANVRPPAMEGKPLAAGRRVAHSPFAMRVTVWLGRCVGLLALAVVLAAGCANDEPPARTPAERAARAQALIEAGNAAYRGGDYRLAARRYAAAAVVRKDDPAAYFGQGMALSKLGRDDEARAAFARAKELASKREAPGGR